MGNVSTWSLAVLWNTERYFLVLVAVVFFPLHSPSIPFTLEYLNKSQLWKTA